MNCYLRQAGVLKTFSGKSKNLPEVLRITFDYIRDFSFHRELLLPFSLSLLQLRPYHEQESHPEVRSFHEGTFSPKRQMFASNIENSQFSSSIFSKTTRLGFLHQGFRPQLPKQFSGTMFSVKTARKYQNYY